MTLTLSPMRPFVARPRSTLRADGDTTYIVHWWTGRLAAPGALRGTGHGGEIVVTR